MLFSFARIAAAAAMRVEDIFVEGGHIGVRLHERGGKLHAVPCNSMLEQYLLAHIDGARPTQGFPVPHGARLDWPAFGEADASTGCA